MPQELVMVLRLLLAAALGGVIGAQREWLGRPAGFRTLAIVSLGAALFSLISQFGFPGSAPAYIAAGVVTGIGFLGAGEIFHRRGGIEGLTTAAAMWVSAGVGLASGVGLYLIAVVTTLFTLIILFLPHIKPRTFPKKEDNK
jgi:putative Mg2+ transporter-C (MgtC) family protein